METAVLSGVGIMLVGMGIKELKKIHDHIILIHIRLKNIETQLGLENITKEAL